MLTVPLYHRNLAIQLDADHERYFTEEDRAGMVSDVLSMAIINVCPMSNAMTLLR